MTNPNQNPGQQNQNPGQKPGQQQGGGQKPGQQQQDPSRQDHKPNPHQTAGKSRDLISPQRWRSSHLGSRPRGGLFCFGTIRRPGLDRGSALTGTMVRQSGR